MKCQQIALASLLAGAALFGATAHAAGSDLEYFLADGKAISLTVNGSVLAIGSQFDEATIKAALPGYDVRFEPEARHAGSEGGEQPGYIISRGGQTLLQVFGDEFNGQVKAIEGMSGVIDAAGATIGSQLKAAYTTGKATCSNFEGAVCWEEGVPDISYLVGGPEGCGSDAKYSRRAEGNRHGAHCRLRNHRCNHAESNGTMKLRSGPGNSGAQAFAVGGKRQRRKSDCHPIV